MVRHRRDILATLAAGGALLAGCAGLDSSDDGDSGDGPDDGNNGNDDNGSDSSEADGYDGDGDGADTSGEEEQGPHEQLPDERFPAECPEYDTVDRVVCYDVVDPDEMPAVVEPSARTITEGEPVEFTFQNHSAQSLSTNFANWLVHKRVDGEWVSIPRVIPLPLAYLSPGDSHTWEFVVDNDPVEQGKSIPWSLGSDSESSEGPTRLRGLGGGQYAFRGRGWFEEDSHEDAIAFATTFEIDADPLQLTVTDAIADTEWNGETLLADAESRDEDKRRKKLDVELERLDADPGDAERVIPEELIRENPHRDAIALAEIHDADHVRIDAYEAPVTVMGSDDGVIEYQGTHYELTTEELETDHSER